MKVLSQLQIAALVALLAAQIVPPAVSSVLADTRATIAWACASGAKC